MDLNELIGKMKPDSYIKIGTKHGSNFVFAGTAAEVAADIPKKTEHYLCKTQRDYEAKRRKYEDAQRIYETCLEAEKRAKKREMVRQKTFFDYAEKALQDFQPFGDREVIERFYAHRIVDDIDARVLVAIVPGTEVGRWSHIGAAGKPVKCSEGGKGN